MHFHICMLQQKKNVVWYQGQQFLDSLGPLPMVRRCKYDCNISLLETLARCIFAEEFEFAYAKLHLTYCDIYSSLDMGFECNHIITNVLL